MEYIKDGKAKRKAKKVICKECGKEWLQRLDRESFGYCRNCLTKGVRNPMYGKKPWNIGEKKYNRKQYHSQRKKDLVAMFGNKCYICGEENLPISNYEFHHIDKSKKEYTISRIILWKMEKIKKELEKVIMVCANCHKTIHSGGERLCQ